MKLKISKGVEQKLSLIAVLYLIIGLFFAIYFAFYYHWEWFGYFSPNFFSVVFTWPFQLPGFINDITYYGPIGKPTGF
jgi:hypothetical protein